MAGGFVEKGKQARANKFVSLAVFVSALVLLALFNFLTINFNALDHITIQSIVIRAILNLPLIWIATVANVSLNKYARLEEEYAHKESLAKSYERYKDEVDKLEEPDLTDTLKAKLIDINLSAFRKNPADTMKDARSNIPFFSKEDDSSTTKNEKSLSKKEKT